MRHPEIPCLLSMGLHPRYEIAHVLLSHEHTAGWDQFIGLLAGTQTRALIQLILGRSASTSAEERDAETLVSLILSNTTRYRDEP